MFYITSLFSVSFSVSPCLCGRVPLLTHPKLSQPRGKCINHNQRWTAEKISQRIELLGVLWSTAAVKPYPIGATWVSKRRRTRPTPTPAWITQPGRPCHITAPGGKPGLRFLCCAPASRLPADWAARGLRALPAHRRRRRFQPPRNAGLHRRRAALFRRPPSPGDAPAAAAICDGQAHMLALHGWVGNLKDDPHPSRLQMRACRRCRSTSPRATSSRWRAARWAPPTALHENDPAARAALQRAGRGLHAAGYARAVRRALLRQRAGRPGGAARRHRRCGPPLPVEVIAAGHAHIDVAWLWTLGQTRRKAGRTFHTVLRLMEQFPDYHFTQSQPQLYDYVRQDYPALFEAIKAARGRRALGADRRHVGRGRLQPERRRIAGAPVPAGAQLLPRAFRRRTPNRPCSGCPTSSAMPGPCRS